MDQDVLVVIGVGGMGTAVARRLGSGRKVLLADFDETTLHGVTQTLHGEGHDVTSQVVDVSDPASVAALADAAAALGAVTHVVHTAGLSPEQASTEAVLKVDLLGVALVLDEFARVVAPGGAGVVVASMGGHMVPVPDEQAGALAGTATAELLSLPFLAPETLGNAGIAYALAKHANVLRVQASASAWGERGARINSISPGVISTPMGRRELDGESGQGMKSMVAMSATGRLGTPDDIASAAEFLLDRRSSFITGTDLLVDGGVVAAIRSARRAG